VSALMSARIDTIAIRDGHRCRYHFPRHFHDSTL
jgi:hypothetical protein